MLDGVRELGRNFERLFRSRGSVPEISFHSCCCTSNDSPAHPFLRDSITRSTHRGSHISSDLRFFMTFVAAVCDFKLPNPLCSFCSAHSSQSFLVGHPPASRSTIHASFSSHIGHNHGISWLFRTRSDAIIAHTMFMKIRQCHFPTVRNAL